MESLDILYLTLSVCVTLLTVFLTITLIYLMFILRDVTKIADKAREVVDKVDRYITKPILMTKSIIEFVGPFIEGAEKKLSSKKKGKK
jgi:predicted PurR-regulated permease PerM